MLHGCRPEGPGGQPPHWVYPRSSWEELRVLLSVFMNDAALDMLDRILCGHVFSLRIYSGLGS